MAPKWRLRPRTGAQSGPRRKLHAGLPKGEQAEHDGEGSEALRRISLMRVSLAYSGYPRHAIGLPPIPAGRGEGVAQSTLSRNRNGTHDGRVGLRNARRTNRDSAFRTVDLGFVFVISGRLGPRVDGSPLRTSFPSPLEEKWAGAPRRGRLASLSRHSNAGVKYFSGMPTCRTSFHAAAPQSGEKDQAQPRQYPPTSPRCI